MSGGPAPDPDPPDPGRPAAVPIPVGIGLIRRGDAFLVRRRPAGTVYADYWEFPGGKCEPGETPAEATARECLEEVGLRVIVKRLRRTVTHRYAHGLVELYFHDGTTEDPAAEPDPESGFRWVLVEQLAALRFPEANEVILEELARDMFPGPDGSDRPSPGGAPADSDRRDVG